MDHRVKVTVLDKNMNNLTDLWVFDSRHDCWCMENVVYSSKPTDKRFQRLHIYVPGPYLSRNGIEHDVLCGKYTADTAPVIFHNESGGYMQMPPNYIGVSLCTARDYLDNGMIFVSCGLRGVESKYIGGREWCGKAPTSLVDLKTAIRFLRHNSCVLPGNYERIISVGMSSGGAMSALLGVTGDNENYLPLLERNGAFMDESDSVYAAQVYCPIIDLEHADMAYEWNYRADLRYEASITDHSGTMNGFEKALSEKLGSAYIRYFNDLGLKNPENGEILALGEDGRSGSGYEYLLGKLSQSATKYLHMLSDGRLPEDYCVNDYLSGSYMLENREHSDVNAGMMRMFMGREPNLNGKNHDITSGTMLSLMPRGMRGNIREPKKNCHGKEKSWLSWDGDAAMLNDLDSYVLEYRGRYKPCPAFDKLKKTSAENRLFGNRTVYARHFNTDMPEMLEALKKEYPDECQSLLEEYEDIRDDQELERQKYLMNPFNFIGTEEISRQAKYFRIRTGALDADTSLAVSMTLSLLLQEAGIQTDYAIVWEKPHCNADYPGELQEWIKSIC